MASNQAPSAGYNCNFVSEPDDALKCLICSAVARKPWQHGKCGRLFCKTCLNEYGKDKPCPDCGKKPKYTKDTKSKSILDSCGVFLWHSKLINKNKV